MCVVCRGSPPCVCVCRALNSALLFPCWALGSGGALRCILDHGGGQSGGMVVGIEISSSFRAELTASFDRELMAGALDIVEDGQSYIYIYIFIHDSDFSSFEKSLADKSPLIPGSGAILVFWKGRMFVLCVSWSSCWLWFDWLWR